MNFISSHIKQIKDLDDRVLWHECGHCVCTYMLNKTFSFITVEPEEGSPYRGYVAGVQEGTAIENAIISYGGIVAEKIRFGYSYHPHEGQEEDIKAIDKIIKKEFGLYRMNAGHQEVSQKCANLLNENWNKVETLAKELKAKRKLTFNEVKELLK